MKNIKQEIILEINRQIKELYPTKGLKIVNANMDNPNDISDFSVIARYVNKELYHLYLDFESMVIDFENEQEFNNKNYLSEFANSIKMYNRQPHVVIINAIKNIFSK